MHFIHGSCGGNSRVTLVRRRVPASWCHGHEPSPYRRSMCQSPPSRTKGYRFHPESSTVYRYSRGHPKLLPDGAEDVRRPFALCQRFAVCCEGVEKPRLCKAQEGGEETGLPDLFP